MTNAYRKFAVAGIALTTVGVLAGCGTASSGNSSQAAPAAAKPAANTAKPAPQSSGGLAIINEVSWHGTVYNEGPSISKVGKQIGTIQQKVSQNRVSKSSKATSNFAKAGTKLFSIPGTSTSKAIAVQLPNGKYSKAVAAKQQ